MSRTPTHDDFARALALLGLRAPAPGGESEWRDAVLRPAWREAVRKTHPDLAAGMDDRAELARRTEETATLNDAYGLLQTLRVRRRPAAPIVRIVVVGGFTTSAGCQTASVTMGTPVWPGASDRWGETGPTRRAYPGVRRD